MFNLVKAYLQKGSTLQALKEPSQALVAYSKALEIDPNCPVSLIIQTVSHILTSILF